MTLVRMCLNWKVLVGLTIVAVGLSFVASPAAFAVALPFLLAAVCPLSMVLMMRAMPMTHGGHTAKPGSTPQAELVLTPIPAPSVKQ